MKLRVPQRARGKGKDQWFERSELHRMKLMEVKGDMISRELPSSISMASSSLGTSSGDEGKVTEKRAKKSSEAIESGKTDSTED